MAAPDGCPEIQRRRSVGGREGPQWEPVNLRPQLMFQRGVNGRVGARLIAAFLVAPSARAAAPLCSKLCSKPVTKGRIGTGQDRIEIVTFSAGNLKMRRDSRGADRTPVGLANRRLQPLGHLTADAKYT
jgi:hypothetical protein